MREIKETMIFSRKSNLSWIKKLNIGLGQRIGPAMPHNIQSGAETFAKGKEKSQKLTNIEFQIRTTRY